MTGILGSVSQPLRAQYARSAHAVHTQCTRSAHAVQELGHGFGETQPEAERRGVCSWFVTCSRCATLRQRAARCAPMCIRPVGSVVQRLLRGRWRWSILGGAKVNAAWPRGSSVLVPRLSSITVETEVGVVYRVPKKKPMLACDGGRVAHLSTVTHNACPRGPGFEPQKDLRRI